MSLPPSPQNRDLVLGNAVVTRQPGHTLARLLHVTSVISNITGSSGALTTRSIFGQM